MGVASSDIVKVRSRSGQAECGIRFCVSITGPAGASATCPLHIVVFWLDTTGYGEPQSTSSFRVLDRQGEPVAFAPPGARLRTGPLGKNRMQYLPGFTVQCINPLCDARGHWLRADATGPISDDGRCPCCGDMLRNVPPPLGPRFRMRPRALTARPPLRPRPR
jgi:hypothetical protein